MYVRQAAGHRLCVHMRVCVSVCVCLCVCVCVCGWVYSFSLPLFHCAQMDGGKGGTHHPCWAYVGPWRGNSLRAVHKDNHRQWANDATRGITRQLETKYIQQIGKWSEPQVYTRASAGAHRCLMLDLCNQPT